MVLGEPGEPPFFRKPPYNVGHPIIINHDVMGKNMGNPRTQFHMMAQFHCFFGNQWHNDSKTIP